MSRKVRDIKKYREISIGFFGGGGVIAFFGKFTDSVFLLILGISLMCVFITMGIILWRCPVCKERLPLRIDSDTDIDDVHRCPYC
jgi:hypothetical protein